MSKFEHRRTPLHFAVLKNQAEIVELLLRHGADPKATDDRDVTPLNEATAKTDRRIVEALLAAGATRKELSDNRFSSAIPILNVKSLPAAIDLLRRKARLQKALGLGRAADLRLRHTRRGRAVPLPGRPGWTRYVDLDLRAGCRSAVRGVPAPGCQNSPGADQLPVGHPRDECRGSRRPPAALEALRPDRRKPQVTSARKHPH